MKAIKKVIFVIIPVAIILVTLSCSGSRKGRVHLVQQHYLPNPIKKLYFGMPFAEFKTIRTDVDTLTSETDRSKLVMYEEPVDSLIKTITYHFGQKRKKSLYEIVVEYEQPGQRDSVAVMLMGMPNYKDQKWKLDTGEDFFIHAWFFLNRIVYVGEIKGTPWESEY